MTSHPATVCRHVGQGCSGVAADELESPEEAQALAGIEAVLTRARAIHQSRFRPGLSVPTPVHRALMPADGTHHGPGGAGLANDGGGHGGGHGGSEYQGGGSGGGVLPGQPYRPPMAWGPRLLPGGSGGGGFHANRYGGGVYGSSGGGGYGTGAYLGEGGVRKRCVPRRRRPRSRLVQRRRARGIRGPPTWWVRRWRLRRRPLRRGRLGPRRLLTGRAGTHLPCVVGHTPATARQHTFPLCRGACRATQAQLHELLAPTRAPLQRRRGPGRVDPQHQHSRASGLPVLHLRGPGGTTLHRDPRAHGVPPPPSRRPRPPSRRALHLPWDLRDGAGPRLPALRQRRHNLRRRPRLGAMPLPSPRPRAASSRRWRRAAPECRARPSLAPLPRWGPPTPDLRAGPQPPHWQEVRAQDSAPRGPPRRTARAAASPRCPARPG
mmetsp:Transcript_40053/g.89874  ORF Transcript_40053/g.89874 Transcript_40053/m.89874 type:complete len:436 (+) Transcript_40053:1068-2375(+)